MFPWYPIVSVVSLADCGSPLRCESVGHISHTPRRPNVRTAYFLMRGRTQSVCAVKSPICQSNPISCAAHSHPVLLTQNKRWYGFTRRKIKSREARSGSGEDTFNCKVCSPRNVTFVVFWVCIGGNVRPTVWLTFCFTTSHFPHIDRACALLRGWVCNPQLLHDICFLNLFLIHFKTRLFRCAWLLRSCTSLDIEPEMLSSWLSSWSLMYTLLALHHVSPVVFCIGWLLNYCI